MRLIRDRLVYAATIACSSALLFAIQPIAAKALLPRFGGSAGVWITSILFFQLVLLLGYLYSYVITRHLNRWMQAAVHAVLLAASACLLPWKPPGTAEALGILTRNTGSPVLSILSLLTALIGLPFFLLSTTSPLVQSWYARSAEARFPYRLFALSNAASLFALLSYPTVIEPAFTERHQLQGWSTVYLLFICLSAISAFRNRASEVPSETAEAFPDGGADKAAAAPRPLLWIALAACAATLWPAVANYLSQEVAAIPFLWVLPLSLYLLSFILCFESANWYAPRVFRLLLPVGWIAISSRLALQGSAGGLQWDIPVFSAALFICCMFCHGELARLKPAADALPFFYLMVALGGALGAVFVGLAAPNLFSTYLELPIGVAASVLLSLPLLYHRGSPRQLLRPALIAAAAFFFATQYGAGARDVIRIRNFYGALQVVDSAADDSAIRSLYNGKTLHGVEFLSPERSRVAASYYGPESGVGMTLQAMQTPNRQVGIVGLGAGALAVYGRPGDSFRFYEINPAVIQVAERDFHFLSESAARISVIAADGRLAMEREPLKHFNLIVLDAFSGDSIPIHLLTRDAFAMYFQHLVDGGILAIHVTNRYLDLGSLVEAQAAGMNKRISIVHNRSDPERAIQPADWAVISDQRLSYLTYSVAASRKVRSWTDDYSNLFQLIK